MFDTWSVVVAAASLFASVVGFSTLRVIDFRRDRQLAQGAAVSRVLDTVERSTRVLATSSVSGIWTNHVFELAQVLPRLLVDLNRRDQVIAVWVYREIQALVLAKGRRESARIIQHIGYTLTEWKNGQKSRAWFAKELTNNPPVLEFAVPKSARMKLNARPLLTLLTFPVFVGFALGVGYRASALVSPERSSTWGSLTRVKA